MVASTVLGVVVQSTDTDMAGNYECERVFMMCLSVSNDGTVNIL